MLEGLTVLEFSHTVMGPCAGMILADLGANVIKIEPAPGGDRTRELPGFAAGFFATFNRNKRSLAVNLKSAEGLALVHQLAADADIVLDNYGPGTMEKLGCGWDQLKRINERLIFLSLKGYLAGPWQDRPALDEVVQFQSGLAFMTGPPGQPLRAGASVIDILGAVFGVSATLAALHERSSSGRGQRVCSSLFESAAFLMAPHMMAAVATEQALTPMPARRGAWAIYDVFQSRDNIPLFVGVTSDAQWSRFCREFRLTELSRNVALATNADRTLAREWLIPQLRAELNAYDWEHLAAMCERADVSWAPVGRPEELSQNTHLSAGGGLLDVALQTINQAVNVFPAEARGQIPGLPLEFGEHRARATVRRQPPACGEHSRAIVKSIGVTDETFKRLLEAGVIAEP